ncbi:MAG TPA: PDZ domain-containing protein [Planctomycetota bacterium]
MALAATLSAQGAILGIHVDPAATGDGAVVADVLPRSAAMVVGLQPGDAILAFDGDPIGNGAELVRAVSFRLPGEVVDLVVKRAGKRLELMAVLGRNPQSQGPFGLRAMRPLQAFPFPALPQTPDPFDFGHFPGFDSLPGFEFGLALPESPGARKEVQIRYPESTPQAERSELIREAREKYGDEVQVEFEGEGTSIRIHSYLERTLDDDEHLDWGEQRRLARERKDA